MNLLQQPGKSGKRIFIDKLKRNLATVRNLRQALYLGDHRFRIQLSVKSLVSSHITETATLQADFDILPRTFLNGRRIIDLRPGSAGGVGAADVLQDLARTDF